MNKKAFFATIFLGVAIAAGLAAAGYYASLTIYRAKVALNTAESKGLAVRYVKSNRADWYVSFEVSSKSKGDIASLYAEAERNQRTITAILRENGLKDEEISIGILSYYNREYRDEKQVLVEEKHIISGTVSVATQNVELIEKVRDPINKLITKGININNSTPQYRFTGLNSIKPDMLKEATKNARIAANEFADNAGVKVGGIRNARQGSFYIKDAGTEYGDTARIDKEVRVVTNITFYLTE